jgi:hypothetical protein
MGDFFFNDPATTEIYTLTHTNTNSIPNHPYHVIVTDTGLTYIALSVSLTTLQPPTPVKTAKEIRQA